MQKILSEINTFACLSCGAELAESAGFCISCLKSLPFILDPACTGCGSENDGIFDLCGKCLKEDKRPWETAFALMRMEGSGKELIHRFKYGNETAIARSMGELAAGKITNPEIAFDCIVPIPLHWTRRMTRGYNQTMLFAEVLSKKTGRPVKHLLKRIKATPRQVNLDRKKRLKNLAGAFAVKNPENCKNRKILLVDDVMTTGTTLSFATTLLLEAGVEKVDVLVLLRA